MLPNVNISKIRGGYMYSRGERKQHWLHICDKATHLLIRTFLFLIITVITMQTLMLFHTVRQWLCLVEHLEGIPYQQHVIERVHLQ